jgi:HPr kinase/phosphorylase
VPVFRTQLKTGEFYRRIKPILDDLFAPTTTLLGSLADVFGVGLIDIPAIFGIRAVRQQKRMEVVVHLEEWDQDAVVDRTGLDTETTTILGVELPKIKVFLNPGKNITVIAEVIAMNHLLRYSGVNPAEAFNERLIGRMREQADVRQYLVEDDE